jgi:hypothetical protein
MQPRNRFISPLHTAKEYLKVLDFTNELLLVLFQHKNQNRLELISHDKV